MVTNFASIMKGNLMGGYNAKAFKKRSDVGFLKIGTLVFYGFILLIPLLVFHWMMPFADDVTIGNDYTVYSPSQQIELQYSLKHRTWPLYVPGFAGGRPSAALTLGQLFHPISHVAAAIPGYWEGRALEITTLLRLLTLGMAHLLLLRLLLRLDLSLVIAFTCSFVTVYNLRMLDTFRFGASLENYTGCLFLCISLTFYFLQPSYVPNLISVIASTFFMTVGGHPQMMYFGMIASGIMILLIPFAVPAIKESCNANSQSVFGFYKKSICLLAIGISLSAAYVIPLYFDFVSETAIRAKNAYAFSLLNCDTWGGELNNFFQPLRSAVTGVFGGSSLISVILLIPVLTLFRNKAPSVIYVVFGFFVLIFLLALGHSTPLHYWYWAYFPLADTFRVPGRITMVLPFLLMLMLSLIWRRGEKKISPWGKDFKLPISTLLFLGALLLHILYEIWIKYHIPEPVFPLPIKFRQDYPGWIFNFVFWSGAVVLFLAALYGFKWRGRHIVGLLLTIVVLLQTGIQIKYGTWLNKSPRSPTIKQMEIQKKQNFAFAGHPGTKMVSDIVYRRMNNSFLEGKLAKFYREYNVVDSQDEAFISMAINRRPNSVVIEKFDKNISPAANSGTNGKIDRVELKEVFFNRLKFAVSNQFSGFLSLAFLDNYRWTATINGKETKVYRANGAEPAVYLLAGKHVVEYRFFSPAAMAGMIISLMTLASIFVFLCLQISHFRIRCILIVISLIFCFGLFMIWKVSLYSGDNIGTKYIWTSDQFPNPDNLAYSRTSRMSSMATDDRPYLSYSGRAVDGDRKSPGFMTKGNQKRPWWQVDLGKTFRIRVVDIFDGEDRKGRYYLPIDILISNDGKIFTKVMSIKHRSEDYPWRTRLNSIETRFLRIQSSTTSVPFGFKEVEVYAD